MITYYPPKIHPLNIKAAYCLTDLNLSEIIGIDERQIRNWRAGKGNPSEQVQKLCGLLHEHFQREGIPCNHRLIKYEEE